MEGPRYVPCMWNSTALSSSQLLGDLLCSNPSIYTSSHHNPKTHVISSVAGGNTATSTCKNLRTAVKTQNKYSRCGLSAVLHWGRTWLGVWGRALTNSSAEPPRSD
eukprot:12560-Eustigmatos_ZCMA.PRE.1